MHLEEKGKKGGKVFFSNTRKYLRKYGLSIFLKNFAPNETPVIILSQKGKEKVLCDFEN